MRRTLAVACSMTLAAVPIVLLFLSVGPDCLADCAERVWTARLVIALAILVPVSVVFAGFASQISAGIRMLLVGSSVLSSVLIAYYKAGGS